MRILCIADVPSKALWDHFDKARLEGVDLILSAGDLPPQYLSFLVTFAQCPLLYVHGNHDQKYEKTPPEGCICIEDKIYVHEGIRILGLGGSMCYTGGAHQYTEAQMAKRVRHLRWQLLRHHGFDVLLTHSPASGLGDLPDLPHRGFEVFHRLLEKYEPKWMVHGHVHTNYGRGIQRICTSGRTMIVNASERYMLEYEEIPEEIS